MTYLISLILIFTSISVLGDSSHQIKCFQDNFSNPRIYQPFQCERNIRNLISKCRFTENAQVLFIYSPFINKQTQKRGPVRPKNPRNKVSAWSHHVVLLSEGKILDFDYSIAPKIVSKEEYFNDMFLPNQDLVMRLIPAADYLYYYKGNPESYIQNFYQDLPQEINLELFLQSNGL